MESNSGNSKVNELSFTLRKENGNIILGRNYHLPYSVDRELVERAIDYMILQLDGEVRNAELVRLTLLKANTKTAESGK